MSEGVVGDRSGHIVYTIQKSHHTEFTEHGDTCTAGHWKDQRGVMGGKTLTGPTQVKKRLGCIYTLYGMLPGNFGGAFEVKRVKK